VDRGRLRTFVLGGAAGLLAGVLLAPRSGRELRGSLSDRAGEARERGRESFFERREGMRERRAALLEGRNRPPVHDVPAEAPPPRPRLREVSADPGDHAEPTGGPVEGSVEGPLGGPVGEPVGEAERSEELRRKVRETRERLRGKRDAGPGA
jgi:YtxH-like protein